MQESIYLITRNYLYFFFKKKYKIKKLLIVYQVLLITKIKKQTKKKFMLGNKIPDKKNHKGILNIVADVFIK